MFLIRFFARLLAILAVVLGVGVGLAWAWDRSEAPAVAKPAEQAALP